jgi:hypothetical protein
LGSSEKIPNSSLVQSLVELVVNAQVVRSSFGKLPSSGDLKSCSGDMEEISLGNLSSSSIVIKSAIYGEPELGQEFTRDVTVFVKDLARLHNDKCLPLPDKLTTLPFLAPDLDGFLLNELPSERKRLHIEYDILQRVFDSSRATFVQKTKHSASTVFSFSSSPAQHKLSSRIPFLKRLESLALFTSEFSRSRKPTSDILSACVKGFYLFRDGAVLIGPKRSISPLDSFALGDPYEGLFSSPKFTYAFWIRPRETFLPLETSRHIFSKGLSCDSTSMRVSIPEKSSEFSVLITYGNSASAQKILVNLPTDSWAHVAICSDGYEIRVYINGKFIQKKQIPPRSKALSIHSNFYFGQLPDFVQDHIMKAADIDIASFIYLRRSYHEETLVNLVSAGPETFSGVIDPQMISGKDIQGFEKSQPLFSEEMDKTILDLFLRLEEIRLKAFKIKRSQIRLTLTNPFEVQIDEDAIKSRQVISHLTCDQIRFRFIFLQLINLKVLEIMRLVDFSKTQHPWSLAHHISSMQSVILYEIKISQLENALAATESGNRQRVDISRPKALRAKEKGDPDGTKSVFGQIYKQLHFIRPSQLRISDRQWSVLYLGEGGTDAGGLFRDSLSALCADLQSDTLPLFIRCPNARGFGDNQEKYIPNPACRSSLHLSMYRFVGKIIGMAIRGRHALNLDFPSIVWKPLAGQKPTRNDLKAIDALCYEVLERVSTIQNEGVTAETFNDYIPYHFTTMASNGEEIELKEHGSRIPVTWDNRHEFTALVESYRIKEFDVQVEAMRQGLAAIVPVHLLSLFSWEELELMVCGQREIDIDLLRVIPSFCALC